jgi:para-aminobenzoate synthetase component I
LEIHFTTFPIQDFTVTKQQVLRWVNQSGTCCFLDNHEYSFNPHSYECLAGAGIKSAVSANAGDALSALQVYQAEHRGWLFGHLGYDLKNEIEQLSSAHPDNICFPDLFFFEPETVLLLSRQELCISGDDAAAVFDAIQQMELFPLTPAATGIQFRQRFSRADYIGIIEKIRQHIIRGDCYEINFCQEFFAEHVSIDPAAVYRALSAVSPSPFAAFYKLNGKYLLCASPERYLKKEGNTIISQPIKGTGPRYPADTSADALSRAALHNSSKDRAENVMVVDLVRNDLSRICREGTVQVEELFGIYSFPQVHQMVSTVRGVLQPDVSLASIIRNTFPMGSMTGAPKKKVMELIEQYETVKRGIFSGAVGYIAPGGDFDFNVVIRSILYNASSQYLSYLTGSGITFFSEAAAEYEECLLKAAAIKKVFA